VLDNFPILDLGFWIGRRDKTETATIARSGGGGRLRAFWILDVGLSIGGGEVAGCEDGRAG